MNIEENLAVKIANLNLSLAYAEETIKVKDAEIAHLIEENEKLKTKKETGGNKNEN